MGVHISASYVRTFDFCLLFKNITYFSCQYKKMQRDIQVYWRYCMYRYMYVYVWFTLFRLILHTSVYCIKMSQNAHTLQFYYDSVLALFFITWCKLGGKFGNFHKINADLLYIVEPRYKRGPWDHENYLVITGFSLYQGKKTKEYKELGPFKLPCYKRVMLYPTSL